MPEIDGGSSEDIVMMMATVDLWCVQHHINPEGEELASHMHSWKATRS